LSTLPDAMWSIPAMAPKARSGLVTTRVPPPRTARNHERIVRVPAWLTSEIPPRTSTSAAVRRADASVAPLARSTAVAVTTARPASGAIVIRSSTSSSSRRARTGATSVVEASGA
jgi:hypothetical protein